MFSNKLSLSQKKRNYILALQFYYFAVFKYRALHFKEINIVLKWSQHSSPLKGYQSQRPVGLYYGELAINEKTVTQDLPVCTRAAIERKNVVLLIIKMPYTSNQSINRVFTCSHIDVHHQEWCPLGLHLSSSIPMYMFPFYVLWIKHVWENWHIKEYVKI